MLMLVLACGKSPQVFTAAGADAPEFGSVGLVAPVFLADTSESAFDDGVFVGNIVMAGGYVVSERGDYGMQTHSKDITLSSQEPYRQMASESLAEMLESGLSASSVAWKPIELEAPELERRKVRGTHPEDGKDNVNLPRFTLSPGALDPVEGVDQVLVPYVVRYYSHNSGWFYGQEKGCGSGARLRVMWVLYDARSGAVQAWRDIDVRTLDPYIFSPSSAQVEDALIEVEGLVRHDLERHLF